MRFAWTDDVSDDETEEEPAHPMGFTSPFGKTWFSLDPPTPTQLNAAFGRTTYGLFDSDDEDNGDADDADDIYNYYDNDSDEESKENNRTTCHIQSYPPLSSYMRAETTPVLLAADRASRRSRNIKTDLPRILATRDNDDDLYYSGDDDDNNNNNGDSDSQALVVFSQSSYDDAKLLPVPPAIQNALSSPSPSHESQIERQIQQKLEQERQRIDEDCRRNDELLRNLVLKFEKEAAATLKKRQAQEMTQLQEQETRDEQERLKEEARELKAATARKETEQKVVRQLQQQAEAEEKMKEADEEAKKKVEHIVKAKHKVNQLVKIRKSIEPFEQNKVVSKRRLGMKKIARGKLNTLSESAEKVRAVATEVSQAITQARHDDAQVKQAIAQLEPGVTSEMGLGKRYFLDLLTSNAMSRVQAETFSGIKGDAFPLAAMLSMIAVEHDDLHGMLAAHIFTVCPTAIPTLPEPKPDASEEDLMVGLGMQKIKGGEFESFPRFLARTENVISFMADIQSSLPSSSTLMGGNLGAIKWLERFLDLLPPPPTSPLPLITAPVLGAFLNRAGHMLANKHLDAFKKLLNVITGEIVNRLDEGEIGRPFAIRLSKVLDGGFEQFRTILPPKAIPELYYGASGESKRHSEGSVFGGTIGADDEPTEKGPGEFSSRASLSSSPHNPFGTSNRAAPTSSIGSVGSLSVAGGTPSNPFGSSGSASTGFSFNSNARGTPSYPFGSSGSTSSGFGRGGNENATPLSFEANAAGAPPFTPAGSEPFGDDDTPQTSNKTPGLGSKQSDISTINRSNNAAANPSPFSSNATAGQNAFGSSTSATANQSIFGGGSINAQSSFGGGNSMAVNASPFGGGQSVSSSPLPHGGASTMADTASPFGSGRNLTANPSPFGSGTNAPSIPPFGFGTNSASNPSPFSSGINSASNPSPFGSGTNLASKLSMYGSGSNAASKPSMFGNGSNASSNPSLFGGNTTSAFGQTPSPFGASSNTSFFAPSTTNATGFGGNNVPASTPFSNQGSSPFGGNTTTPFGSSGMSNPSPFGSGGNNLSTSFSSQNAAPFGAGNSAPFGFSSGSSNSGFGVGGSTPTPFSNQTSSRFGDSNNMQPFSSGTNTPASPFGLSSGFGFTGTKTPCKFFAQGNCRYGANCKFSHDTSDIGNTGGFGGVRNNTGFGSNTPFGGPRR